MSTEPPAPARPEDASAVVGLLAAQLEEHDIPLAPELLVEAIHGALEDDGRALILVAREDDRPVGLAYLSFQWTLERLQALGLITWTRGRSAIHVVVSPRVWP